MSKLGYIRVSTVDQNTGRQLDGITMDRIYTDKCSGKDTNRPALTRLMADVAVGDEVFVHSMDRLARNVTDLQRLVEIFNAKGATVMFLHEHLTFEPDKQKSPMAVLLLQLLGAVAQFERALILERQREGIAKAKERGIYKGRKPVDDAKIQKALELCSKGVSVVDAAKVAGIGKSTVYKAIALAREQRVNSEKIQM